MCLRRSLPCFCFATAAALSPPTTNPRTSEMMHTWHQKLPLFPLSLSLHAPLPALPLTSQAAERQREPADSHLHSNSLYGAQRSRADGQLRGESSEWRDQQDVASRDLHTSRSTWKDEKQKTSTKCSSPTHYKFLFFIKNCIGTNNRSSSWYLLFFLPSLWSTLYSAIFGCHWWWYLGLSKHMGWSFSSKNK